MACDGSGRNCRLQRTLVGQSDTGFCAGLRRDLSPGSRAGSPALLSEQPCPKGRQVPTHGDGIPSSRSPIAASRLQVPGRREDRYVGLENRTGAETSGSCWLPSAGWERRAYGQAAMQPAPRAPPAVEHHSGHPMGLGGLALWGVRSDWQEHAPVGRPLVGAVPPQHEAAPSAGKLYVPPRLCIPGTSLANG